MVDIAAVADVDDIDVDDVDVDDKNDRRSSGGTLRQKKTRWSLI